MIAVVTILSAFALGYRFRSRLAANTTYAVAYLWAFTFQTLYLEIDSVGGDPAFVKGEFPWQYGVVTLAILGAGFGLVEAGHRTAARRARTKALAA
jgi:hypothetical protein